MAKHDYSIMCLKAVTDRISLCTRHSERQYCKPSTKVSYEVIRTILLRPALNVSRPTLIFTNDILMVSRHRVFTFRVV